MKARTGIELTEDEVIASPHIFIGSIERFVEKFQELRERLGISSFMVGSLDEIAPGRRAPRRHLTARDRSDGGLDWRVTDRLRWDPSLTTARSGRPIYRDPLRLALAVGAAIMFVGALLPWAEGRIGFLPKRFGGLDGAADGLILATLGFVLIVIARSQDFLEAPDGGRRWTPMLIGVVCVGIWLLGRQQAEQAIAAWEDDDGSGTLVMGYWVAGIGVGDRRGPRLVRQPSPPRRRDVLADVAPPDAATLGSRTARRDVRRDRRCDRGRWGGRRDLPAVDRRGTAHLLRRYRVRPRRLRRAAARVRVAPAHRLRRSRGPSRRIGAEPGILATCPPPRTTADSGRRADVP